MRTVPFSLNPLTGAVTYWHEDDATGKTHIETVADVEPVIEQNKALSKEMRSDWKGDMHLVASIPPELLPHLEQIGAMTRAGRILDEKILKRWLNDADNRAWRVKQGQV